MFELNKFLMKGFRDAVGKMHDYQIIKDATGWYDKGVLTKTDLAEIEALLDSKNEVKQ